MKEFAETSKFFFYERRRDLMPYQPTLPSPYLCAVDGDEVGGNIFRCLINARDKIDKYKLVIQKYISSTGEYSNDEIYNTEVTLSTPLCGNADNDSWLEINVPSGTLINGNDYIWYVILYTQNSDSTDYYSVYSPEYYFKARSKAVIDFSVQSIVTSSELNIKVNYSQAENVNVSYYCFNLYLKGKKINSTGNVISSNIKYYYDGLLNNESYSLELIITDDDKTQTTMSADFDVSYHIYQSPVIPNVYLNHNKNCLDIDFGKNIIIKGKLQGNQNITLTKFKNGTTAEEPNYTNAVVLSEDQNLYWNEKTGDLPLDLDKTAQIINWHGHNGFIGTIFEKLDYDNPLNKITVKYDGTAFYYKFGTSDEVKVNDVYEVIDGEVQAYSLYSGGITSAVYHRNDATTVPDESELISIYDSVDESMCYVLQDDDMIGEYDVILCNDMVFNYWWTIVVLDNEVRFIKGKKFSETEVV